ncbi:type II toxin-antitoxin system SpoIISA family toxin [Rossellomorea marisflavi]|uniref:type II toxin-antitoxin system SpoIISA family toxin n=1 Tax=Rossellomorea marisflavi TaxID=189381 RepID=UPI003F9FE53A
MTIPEIELPYILSGIVGIYLLLVLIIHIFISDFYFLHIKTFRKVFYFFVMISIGFTVYFGYIAFDNWKILAQILAVGVFLDIVIFQTPDISKLWNTEFKSEEYVLKSVIKTNKIMELNTKKMAIFHGLISETVDLLDNEPLESWEEYSSNFKKYIFRYHENLALSVNITHIKRDEDNSMKLALSSLLNINSVNTTIIRENIDKWVDDFELRTIPLELTNKEENRLFILPFFGDYFDFFISVESKEEDAGSITDIINLINLAYIFNWFHLE